MRFEQELRGVLPPDLPHRENVAVQCARHLQRIVEANEQFNLTRITSPREAAVKHVLDSVLPWRHFAGASHVVDAGTGAGFPGIPLALVFPETRWTLLESVGKKARFVEAAARELALGNVEVVHGRTEEWLKGKGAVVITGRAVAPLGRACALFGAAMRGGSTALFYKGPDAEGEIGEASGEARKQGVVLRVVDGWELPEGAGTRRLVMGMRG